MKFSKIISYIFHPINFPIIGSILFFLLQPTFIFRPLEHTILAVIFIGSYVFPLVLLVMLKRFGLIHSYHMVTIEERKFPTLLFISLCYIIGNWLFKTNVVDILGVFYFGYGLCLFFSYLLLYFKIKMSLHTAAVGGIISFFIYFSLHYKINMLSVLIIFFALSGVIASARLRLKAHQISEVAIGFLLGTVSQFAVYLIYNM